jgi:hypothetical protein
MPVRQRRTDDAIYRGGVLALNQPYPCLIDRQHLEEHELGKEIDRVFREGFHCAWICLEDLRGPSECDVLPWNRSGVLLAIVLGLLCTVSVFKGVNL